MNKKDEENKKVQTSTMIKRDESLRKKGTAGTPDIERPRYGCTAPCRWVSQLQAADQLANQKRRKAQPAGRHLPVLGPRTFLSLREIDCANLLWTPTLRSSAPISEH
jgi:hypothetical protein